MWARVQPAVTWGTVEGCTLDELVINRRRRGGRGGENAQCGMQRRLCVSLGGSLLFLKLSKMTRRRPRPCSLLKSKSAAALVSQRTAADPGFTIKVLTLTVCNTTQLDCHPPRPPTPPLHPLPSPQNARTPDSPTDTVTGHWSHRQVGETKTTDSQNVSQGEGKRKSPERAAAVLSAGCLTIPIK